jgi:acyl-CoA oxidase
MLKLCPLIAESNIMLVSTVELLKESDSM